MFSVLRWLPYRALPIISDATVTIITVVTIIILLALTHGDFRPPGGLL